MWPRRYRSGLVLQSHLWGSFSGPPGYWKKATACLMSRALGRCISRSNAPANPSLRAGMFADLPPRSSNNNAQTPPTWSTSNVDLEQPGAEISVNTPTVFRCEGIFQMRPNDRLLEHLRAAYLPCGNFGICRQAQWAPESGHIPRGFLGATGALEDVELVMVFAEPGHPHPGEVYDSRDSPETLLESGMHHTYQAFATGTDLFHRNVRWFMDQLYPNLTFDQQLRHVWLTEGRLCSIENEIGGLRDHLCAQRYLRAELEMLPNATVAAFGGKAQDYIRGLKVEHLKAYAFAPPGANHKPARPSWEKALENIKSRRVQG